MESRLKPVEKGYLSRRTWSEFRKCGLIWWINRFLHLFGWAIVLEIDEDDSIREVYPARTRFRGFDEETEAAGFKMLSKYLQRVGDQLVDDCEFESEHINLACDKQGFPKRKHNMLSVNDMLEYALSDIDWKLWDAPPECIAEALEKHLVITFDDAKKRSDLCVGRMSDVGWFIVKTDGLEPTIVWIEDKESHNYKHTISPDGKVVFFDLE